MRCERVVERLDALRTNELPVRERREVAEHLETCRSCADENAAVERLAGELGSLQPHAPRDLAAGVIARSAGDEGCGRVDTELGPVWVSWGAGGITGVRIGARGERGLREASARRSGGRRPPRVEVPERYAAALREAAAGRGAHEPPVDLSSLPRFVRDVLGALSRIPLGEVRPYAWLAREAGRPAAVRAVGNALARNPVPLLVPCHRVVPMSGGVGNYAFGSRVKRSVLEREGVPLDDLEALARRGVRYVGNLSDHSYCFPTCGHVLHQPADTWIPLPSSAAAARAGYRPCTTCRPMEAAA
ncbi:MAG TPA: methylated-DNA--[protein]-cysteine S-methyltransferase [Gemmatimonadota bacterium]|jgi:O-6-methylguanine DNA methyltransferase